MDMLELRQQVDEAGEPMRRLLRQCEEASAPIRQMVERYEEIRRMLTTSSRIALLEPPILPDYFHPVREIEARCAALRDPFAGRIAELMCAQEALIQRLQPALPDIYAEPESTPVSFLPVPLADYGEDLRVRVDELEARVAELEAPLDPGPPPSVVDPDDPDLKRGYL